MNKKGFFFSIITVGLILVLIALFLTYQIRDTKTEITVDQVRISTMSDFADDIENELLAEAMRGPARKGLKEMEEQVRSTRNPIEDPEGTLSSKIINGAGELSFQTEIRKLDRIASRSGMNLKLIYDKTGENIDLKEITNNDLAVTQEDPWEVKVTTASMVHLNISSQNPKIEIIREFRLVATIGLKNLVHDPLYARKTGTLLPIREDTTTNTRPTDDSAVRDAITDHKFIAAGRGLSYLDRFTSTRKKLEYPGYERLIHPNEPEASPGFSMIDWENTRGETVGCTVEEMTIGFDCGGDYHSEYRLSNPESFGLTTCSCEDGGDGGDDGDGGDGGRLSNDQCIAKCGVAGYVSGGCYSEDRSIICKMVQSCAQNGNLNGPQEEVYTLYPAGEGETSQCLEGAGNCLCITRTCCQAGETCTNGVGGGCA